MRILLLNLPLLCGVSQEIAIVKSMNDLLNQRHRASIDSTETIEFYEVKSTETVEPTPGTQSKVVDRALIQTQDLISEQFKPWYAKQAYRLGADRYLGIAADARRGRSPAKLFSYMLRRAR